MQKFVYRPPKRIGSLLLLIILILLIAACGALAWLAFNRASGGFFFLYLIGSIIVFFPIPFFLYLLIALNRAKYTITPNGFSMQWGLRTEDIPFSEIDFVRMPNELVAQLPKPPIAFPGAVFGSRFHNDLGKIEFVASKRKNLVLVATKKIIFAISPSNINSFRTDFSRAMEFAPISPIKPQSSQPRLIIADIFADKAAGYLIGASVFLSIILLLVISFMVPIPETDFSQISRNIQLGTTFPGNRLLILPLLVFLFLFLDIGFGAYLFRKKAHKINAYFLFAAGLILPVFFLIFILIAS